MAFLDGLDTEAEFINQRLKDGEKKDDVEWDVDELKQKYAMMNQKEKKEFREHVKEKYTKLAKLLRW